jgi:hypothetical protein
MTTWQEWLRLPDSKKKFGGAPGEEPTKTTKMKSVDARGVSVVFVGSVPSAPTNFFPENRPSKGSESVTPDGCIAAPEPPDNDWDQDGLELISRIKDDPARDEVIAFKNVLGGTLSPAGHAGRFVSADQYQKGMLDGLFAEHRKLQAQQYAGLTLEEKEELARQAERTEKEHQQEESSILVPGKSPRIPPEMEHKETKDLFELAEGR